MLFFGKSKQEVFTWSTSTLLFLTLQGKETIFRGHKLTQNKVQKNNDKKKKTEKVQHLREKYDTGS